MNAVSEFEVITERVHQYLTGNVDDVTRPAKHSWRVTLDSVVVNIERSLTPGPRPMDAREIAEVEACGHTGWVTEEDLARDVEFLVRCTSQTTGLRPASFGGTPPWKR